MNNEKKLKTQIEIFRDYLKEKFEQSQFSSYREFGKAADVDHGYISRMFSGKKNTPPSPEILDRMAKALNIEYNEMMYKAGYLKSYTKDELKKIVPEKRTVRKMRELRRLLDEIDIEYIQVIDTAKQKGLSAEDLEALVEMAETVQGILTHKNKKD